jgi:transposase
MEKESIEFEQYVARGCGMDVHKETVVATISGQGIKTETRTFSTITSSLKSMAQWLKEKGITHVAMESTGVYWKPVYNILEKGFEILLVNARYIKNVPGRKTDKADSKWICKLLRSGLLKGSFIPPGEIRELRDLTRYRRKLTEQISAEKNRIQRILEDANIKLSSVVSDIEGAVATRLIDGLLKGAEIEDLVREHYHGKLSASREELKEAITGFFTDHHRFMITTIKSHIGYLEQQIDQIDMEIDKKVAPCKELIELLKTIPGVGKEGAVGIIAEIGTDMNVFPDEHHLSSWAGMSPGNNESAGKKKVPE